MVACFNTMSCTTLHRLKIKLLQVIIISYVATTREVNHHIRITQLSRTVLIPPSISFH
jgi:hypothetical protein